jgi:chemotaxis signal transduction protein
VPIVSVDQIIEYDVASPVPLAKPWVSGIGTHAERVLVCVSLRDDPQALLPRRRRVQGVLLTGSGRDGGGFVLEVSGVESLIRVCALDAPRAVSNRALPSWLLEGRTSDGRTLGWVDVEALLRDFDE